MPLTVGDAFKSEYRDRMTNLHIFFGGSFFPPHKGHTEIVTQALEKNAGAIFHIVPTKQNPLKSTPAGEMKLIQAWLKDLAKITSHRNFSRCKLETLELKSQAEKTYTVDSLRTLRTEGEEWILLMGADSAATFAKWKNPLNILEQLTEVWVVPRKDAPMPAEITKNFAKLRPSIKVEILAPVTEISSTDLRKQDGAVSHEEQLQKFLSPAVLSEWKNFLAKPL